MPWNQCGRLNKEIGASASDILGIPDSRFSKIAAEDFPVSQKAFGPVFPIPYNQPNKAPEPTITSVTPRADARVAPAALVAHL